MVDPIYIFALLPGTAFVLPLLYKTHRNAAAGAFLAALGFSAYVAGSWCVALVGGAQPDMLFTAGFHPPYSINLLMGLKESIFLSIVNGVGLLGGLYLVKKLREESYYGLVLFMMMILGLSGMIMTRDLFNLFVFTEIASISTYSIIAIERNRKSLSAGFKYLIAGGISSALFLIGTIYLYRFTGTLNLDAMIASKEMITGVAGFTALFLLFVALIIEIKPFPANGWALDVYEGSHPGIAALISAGLASASLYVLYKVLPLFGADFYTPVAWIGILTFLGSNFFGIKQQSARRMLGYSSIGQIGLMLTVLGLSPVIGPMAEKIIFGILITHALAKAGLFWLAGMLKTDHVDTWGTLKESPLLIFLMGTFIFALLGIPPFPSFFAKWSLVLSLSQAHAWGWIAALLFGSFLEALYLLRWFGKAVKMDSDDEALPGREITKLVPLITVAAALYFFGWYTDSFYSAGIVINYVPLFFAAVIFLVDFLPNKVKGVLVLGGIGYYSWMVLPGLEGFALIFDIVFLIGSGITLIASLTKGGQRRGFYPLAILMFAGLTGIAEANNILSFFFAWETMTIGSYLLILRGKKSMPHALSYALFSLGGAYLILFGFGITFGAQETASLSLDILSHAGIYAPVVFILLALGFMTKTAAFGLHIWLPGAHAEAESDVSPLVSAILLKAGVFGLIILMIHIRKAAIGYFDPFYILGWIGAATALTGNIMAAFQEDAKRLLAYSSIGQLGYIIFGLAMMTHLGWLTALLYTSMHVLFKAMLFLAIGGVVMRVGTRNMYEMGGLIKNMPYSFFTVLIGIITLAGIPPLIGFGGKWLFFNAIIEKGWYLQGIVVIFAGIVGFLYCFRLIHSIFLGQLKDNLRKVKEAPVFMLIPQYIFLTAIVVISVKPGLIMKPFGTLLNSVFSGAGLAWKGDTAYSFLGYWNQTAIMVITTVIFTAVFLWLLYNNHNAQKVKQFNIAYAGEVPERPETTHFAYNMYAPYRKALGFLIEPFAERFWGWISDALHALADFFRRFYTGDGQTYALQLLIFTIVLYVFMSGGF